eukprot:10730536-Alexandrium_andersonii.AAC.1
MRCHARRSLKARKASGGSGKASRSIAAASSIRAPRPPTGHPAMGVRRPSAQAVKGRRRMAAPDMPACCMA